MLNDSGLEATLFTLEFSEFRCCEKLYVKVPADLDQFGRNNSHGTVVGWESLVQLGHHPANCRGFLHEIYIISGIGQIQSGLHSGDATTHDHYGS